jgi:hypothetical protein
LTAENAALAAEKAALAATKAELAAKKDSSVLYIVSLVKLRATSVVKTARATASDASDASAI